MNTVIPSDERRGATSASNAGYDLACPGRHLAQVGCPETKSADADFGNKIHAALARETPSAALQLSVAEHEIFDACRLIEKKLVNQFFGDKARVKLFREERIWVKMSGNGKVLEHSGKPDVVYRDGARALIIEYKTLAGDVPESPRNLQLRDQAVLVKGHHVVVEEIGVVVVQPLVTHTSEICVYGLPDLQRAEAEMWARVVASNTPESPRVPGDAQCKFCLARMKCLEYQKWAGGMIPGMFNILEVPVQNWDPQHRTIFLDKCGIAQRWLDDCKEAMLAGMQADPAFVPGYTLKPGNTRQTITDPQACFERFVGIGGDSKEFMAAISVTKGKLKQAIKDSTGATGKALDSALASLCEGIVEETQNRPSIVKVEQA